MITIFSLLKAYSLYIYFKHHSRLNSPAGKMITNMIKLRKSDSLYIKTWLMGMPTKFFFIYLSLCISMCSYALHLAERQSSLNCDDQRGRFSTFWNTTWCVLITVFTIGYGDITAVTLLGRSIIVITGLIGLMNVAILIDVVNKHLILLNHEEMKVISVIVSSMEYKTFQ
jgi:hypothetical protein